MTVFSFTKNELRHLIAFSSYYEEPVNALDIVKLIFVAKLLLYIVYIVNPYNNEIFNYIFINFADDIC